MCEPTFEEWFFSFAGELARLNGDLPDFDVAYAGIFRPTRTVFAAVHAPVM